MTDVLSREQIEAYRTGKIIHYPGGFVTNALCDMALSALDNAEDAERYRWLRATGNFVPSAFGNGWGFGQRLHSATAQDLDAAIDAARKESHD